MKIEDNYKRLLDITGVNTDAISCCRLLKDFNIAINELNEDLESAIEETSKNLESGNNSEEIEYEYNSPINKLERKRNRLHEHLSQITINITFD